MLSNLHSSGKGIKGLCDEMKLNNNFSLPTSYPIHYQKLSRMHSNYCSLRYEKRVAILLHYIYTHLDIGIERSKNQQFNIL